MDANRKEVKRIIQYKATELHISSDVLRELGLPILDYKNGKWNSRSPEAKFLTDKLGLRKHPQMDTILEISANSHDKTLRNSALSYFIENFEAYESFYNATSVKLTFLPCADCKTYATQSNCTRLFRSWDSILSMGITRCRLRSWASRSILVFKCCSTASSATYKEIARRPQKFLNIQSCDWEILRDKKFIPVPDSKSPDGVLLVNSLQFFFESDDPNPDEPNPDEDVYKKLFFYVNFGSNAARHFLRQCGIEMQPKAIDFAQMITDDPKRAYRVCGRERYLVMLRKIAEEYNSIKQHSPLVKKMKDSPFLIGLKKEGVQASAREEAADFANMVNRGDKAIVRTFSSTTTQLRIKSLRPLPHPLNRCWRNSIRQIYIFFKSHFLLSILYLLFFSLGITEFGITGFGKLATFGVRCGFFRLNYLLLPEFWLINISFFRNIKTTISPRDAKKSPISGEVEQRIHERVAIIIYQIQQDPRPERKLLREEEWLRANLKVLEAKVLKVKRKFTPTGAESIQITTASVD
ncbi:hypothetical protein BC936DRAFT_144483 [Jimgerdemannia flammicorona]|uniref:Uncharacterized protein n=1 Tax=Jimgerdemannia flammicorona TaxID=994334 RepID=A0A433DCF2_9FUNG|nr:hypothetical protein BC936DRAFT_144483 [Jimgerdemannia flammicorona]